MDFASNRCDIPLDGFLETLLEINMFVYVMFSCHCLIPYFVGNPFKYQILVDIGSTIKNKSKVHLRGKLFYATI